MKAVPSGACTKRVRFAFPPRFCERTWWLMSYIRILYRCETYFTGKNIWYKFHAFLILSPKSCYSSTLTWPTVDIGRKQAPLWLVNARTRRLSILSQQHIIKNTVLAWNLLPMRDPFGPWYGQDCMINLICSSLPQFCCSLTLEWCLLVIEREKTGIMPMKAVLVS